jgi:hypothetical protein
VDVSVMPATQEAKVRLEASPSEELARPHLGVVTHTCHPSCEEGITRRIAG